MIRLKTLIDFIQKHLTHQEKAIEHNLNTTKNILSFNNLNLISFRTNRLVL